MTQKVTKKTTKIKNNHLQRSCDFKITKVMFAKLRSDLPLGSTGLATSLSRGKKQEKEKKRERLVILGMLINIHEQSSLASIFKNYGVVVNCFIEA